MCLCSSDIDDHDRPFSSIFQLTAEVFCFKRNDLRRYKTSQPIPTTEILGLEIEHHLPCTDGNSIYRLNLLWKRNENPFTTPSCIVFYKPNTLCIPGLHVFKIWVHNKIATSVSEQFYRYIIDEKDVDRCLGSWHPYHNPRPCQYNSCAKNRYAYQENHKLVKFKLWCNVWSSIKRRETRAAF